MATLLEMRSISKAFPGVLANDNIDLAVQNREIHALLGENGAGKSTLMNILYGLYTRDQGEIYFEGEPVDIRSPQDAIALGIGMVHQEFMLIDKFTVTENVALGLDLTQSPFLELDMVEKRLVEISDRHGLAVDPSARIEHLSVGVQQRVEILKLLFREARLLILDEPTAVLTPQETKGFFQVLRSLVSDECSVIFITHKLNEVMEISDRVTVLRDGRVVATKDTADTDPRELAEMMVGREVLFDTHKEPLEPASTMLKIQDLEALDDRDMPALKGISFEIRQNEILGLAGVDGNGQRELAETLAGLRDAESGKIVIGDRDVTSLPPAKRYAQGVSYVPADRQGMGCVNSLDVACNSILGQCSDFAAAGGLVLRNQHIERHARELVSRFDVRCPGTSTLAGKLSGGNLQKLMLGRELMRHPKVMIVEQPTRGLDVGATEYVRQRILEARKSGAAVLLISSELDEILSLSDRIAVIYEGQIVGTVPNENVNIQDLGLMMAGAHKNNEVEPASVSDQRTDDHGR
jgi:simple sugar transport system ATP-binding protein